MFGLLRGDRCPLPDIRQLRNLPLDFGALRWRTGRRRALSSWHPRCSDLLDDMPPVRNHYQSYKPPPWVNRTVTQLLESLSGQYVGGLSSILLTESAMIGRGRSRRIGKRRYAMKSCLGYYQPRSPREPPSIVLVVDNILADSPRAFWRVPFFRETLLGRVLFHEVGHHINDTVGSLAGGEEASAEAWKRRLAQIHFRRKYWYLRPFFRPLRFLVGAAVRILRRMADRRASETGRRHGFARRHENAKT